MPIRGTEQVSAVNFFQEDKKDKNVQPQVAFMNSVFPNFAGGQNDAGESAAFQA